MRFTADAHPGLADGTTSVTFRNWKGPHVKVGGRYRIPGTDIHLEVTRLSRVRVGRITKADARRAGEADVDGVRRRLGGDLGDDAEVFRVEFHRVDPPAGPPLAEQADLTPDDRAELRRRLDHLDAASVVGPWTAATLRIIADRPGVVSTELAAALGRDRPSFKVDVRKLKKLGLTLSMEVGYRLSPRGEAYLAGD